MGGGGVGRGACPSCPALLARPHRAARGAGSPFSAPVWGFRGGCGLLGLEEKSAPRAAAVRNPVVTIVITILFLMAMATIIYLLFSITPCLNRVSKVWAGILECCTWAQPVLLLIFQCPRKEHLFSFF